MAKATPEHAAAEIPAALAGRPAPRHPNIQEVLDVLRQDSPIISTEQVAAEISALIQSKPQSPTQAEIAAILRKSGIGGGEDALFRHRQTWRVLCWRADRLAEKAGDDDARNARADAALAAREAFEDRHFIDARAPQARTLADIVMLSDVVSKTGWPEPEYPADFTGCDRLGHAISVLVRAIRALARREGVEDV